ncbi:uncharacterized protein LOC113653815 isoform X3 [Tachysurus fulvidraco]|uniref:uncharacterized protein LOC113653815 isoform X3 n=1 Tax=Tachysurus fulvidraco TaxID=1234273 RepID=UPI001FEF21A7|nr:uncharacterized protein LOC113653815 isoform X3 [Tachysurus fulvidraco]
MPGGSTKKICPFCQGILFCAQKICCHCKKEQPLKQRLKKRLQRFDDKREEWVFGRKKNHNSASIKDEALIMLEKLHAIGYKPILLLGKQNKKKENKCEILTPRCTLSTRAQDYLQRIGPIYENIFDGWTKDINEDQLITLHLTPCEPLENTSNREVVRTTQLEQTGTTEGEMEQTGTTEGEMEQTGTTDGGMEQTGTTEGEMEQMSTSEGQELYAAVFTGSARGTVTSPKKKKSGGLRHMPERKKPQKNCSYHTRLETFPIRSVVRERVRKGKAEMLVDWEPCPVCGKEWAHSWQPKDSLQMTKNK